MPNLPNSPLFQAASRQLRQEAREVFRGSVTGKVAREIRTIANAARKAGSGSAGGVRELARAVERFKQGGIVPALDEIKGLGFDQMVRQVERYAKQDRTNQFILEQLFSALGPVGDAMKGIVLEGKKADADVLLADMLLRSMGYETLPPRKRRTTSNTKRAALAAIQFLRDMGIPVDVPEEFEFLPQGKMIRRQPLSSTEQGRSGIKRATPLEEVPSVPGMPKVPTNHPIATGEMVEATQSSNVHSVGYDASSGLLYIRFLHHLHGEGKGHGRDPGPLYQYRYVRPEEFLDLYNHVKGTGHAGEWVWDHLRIRGTVSGHQKDYSLVGVTGGYVPRKATLVSDAEAAKFGLPHGGEAYIRRDILTTTQGWLKSSKPNMLAPSWHRGAPNTGAPQAPNRGTPNRG
jgi:hypothetical protein